MLARIESPISSSERSVKDQLNDLRNHTRIIASRMMVPAFFTNAHDLSKTVLAQVMNPGMW